MFCIIMYVFLLTVYTLCSKSNNNILKILLCLMPYNLACLPKCSCQIDSSSKFLLFIKSLNSLLNEFVSGHE